MVVPSKNLQYRAIAGLLILSKVIHGARIMFYFALTSYSHRISVWPLVEELATRNHSITFVSPYRSRNGLPAGVEDYVPIALQNFISEVSKLSNPYKLRVDGTSTMQTFKVPFMSLVLCNFLLNDAEFLEYVKTNKFDLVVVDSFGNECAYGWAFLHGAKLILYSSGNPREWHIDTMGYHDEASWIPDKVFHPDAPLTLWDRSVGLFIPLVYHFVREYLLFPNLEDIIRTKLCPNFPPGSDFERNNTNLVFLNGHYGEDFGRPLPPNVVSVGGMQCNRSRNEDLPKEISEFLDGADTGFIYMSFGSLLQVDSLPRERVEMILSTLKRVNNTKILLKMEKTQASRYDLSDRNIYTMDWMPQRAILAHPKIRAFISHAGLLGIHEAICYAVPLLTFPMFGDQDSNADKVSSRKIGLKLEITTITGNQFMEAIQEVLTNKLYAENMVRQSEIFQDRPSHPVDTAVWWTEYVLRHDDTSHLRPLSVHQPWWMKRQIDVWFCIFSSISFSLTVSVFIVKRIMKALYVMYKSRSDINKEFPKLKAL